MSVWVWGVYALAVARLTGLITADEISRPARDWVIANLPPYPVFIPVEYLLTCPWCVSIWVGAATVLMAWRWGGAPWLLGVALVLAMSQIAGMLAPLGRAAPDDDVDLAATGDGDRAAVTP